MTQAVTLAQLGGADTTLPFRNRIINGAMVIDQRKAGGSTTYGSGSSANGNYFGYNSCDRWFAQSYTSTAGNGFTFTTAQNAGSVTPPPGFSNYWGVTVTSPQATILTSGLFVGARQHIEGYNIADLALGTANAKPLVLSFWVRSSVTGTYTLSIEEYNATAGFQSSYTINTANTWEQKTIAIPACTIGTWPTTNAGALVLGFILGASPDRTGGTANVWSGTYFNSLAGCTNLAATNGATWQVTGVQLEAGTVATPFERRQYGQELNLCYRYCFALRTDSSGYTNYGRFPPAWTTGTTSANFDLFLPTPMRNTAYSVTYNNKQYELYFITGGGGTGQGGTAMALNTDANGLNWVNISLTATSPGTWLANQVGGFRFTNATDAALVISTEL